MILQRIQLFRGAQAGTVSSFGMNLSFAKSIFFFTGWLVSMGFRKVESSAPWEYSCEYFVRGKPLFTPNKWLTETPSSGLEPVPDYVSNFERNVETNLKRILARRVPGYLASR
uniref:Uncharacterized protein n=1 Tax=Noccaea caerulescens TaxID=107243 RepID=A0A1J3KAI6_NOCCA